MIHSGKTAISLFSSDHSKDISVTDYINAVCQETINAKGLSKWRQVTKLKLRAWFHYRSLTHILPLHKSLIIKGILGEDLLFSIKVLRTYLCRQFSAKQRVAALKSHHQHLEKILSIKTYRQLYQEGLTLLEEPSGQGLIRITLGDAGGQGREGQLNLSLLLDDKVVHQITITMISEDLIDKNATNAAHKMAVLIGCSKGGIDQNTLALSKILTKQSHALRPKVLVMYALTALTSAWSIDTIYAVSNYGMVFGSFWLKKRVKADYDSFWKSQGGITVNKHLYKIQPLPRLKSMDDTPSHKRSETKRRNALLECRYNSIRTNALAVIHKKSIKGGSLES